MKNYYKYARIFTEKGLEKSRAKQYRKIITNSI